MEKFFAFAMCAVLVPFGLVLGVKYGSKIDAEMEADEKKAEEKRMKEEEKKMKEEKIAKQMSKDVSELKESFKNLREALFLREFNPKNQNKRR